VKRQITHHDGNKGGTGKGDSRPTPTPNTGTAFIVRQADPARAIEGQQVKKYAKHGGKNRRPQPGVSTSRWDKKPDLHDENTKSTLKQ